MNIRLFVQAIFLLIATTGLVTAGNPPIIVDREDGDDGWFGCTVAPGDCSFPGALLAAAPGDTIVITVPTLVYDTVAINKSVTLQANSASMPRLDVGPSAGAPITLHVSQGRWVDRTGDRGGAMFIHAGHTVSLDNAVFQGNRTIHNSDGGAIYNEGTLTVTQSRFTANHGYRKGGAIYSAVTADGTVFPTVTIDRTLFETNYALNGAAVIHNEGVLDITASRFYQNGVRSIPSGHPPISHFGGIQNQHKATIRDSLFEQNESMYASCIQSGHELVVANTTFLLNKSHMNQEGGVMLLGEKATLANITVIGNFGSPTGGVTTYGGSAVQIVNSVIAQNSGAAPSVLGTIHLIGPNLLQSLSGTTAVGATDDLLIGVNPRIRSPSPNGGPTWTMMPWPDSPVINRGSSCVITGSACGAVLPVPALANDQRGSGFVRSRAGSVDLGATELGAELVTNVLDAGTGSLRAALANTSPGEVILFHPSFQSATQTIALTTPLLMTTPVDFIGPGSSRLTIDGGDAVRVLDIDAPGTSRISGLTFANGRAPTNEDGGAIRHRQGTLEFDSVRFTSSTAKRGGCLSSAAQFQMANAEFTQCEANTGGALYQTGEHYVAMSGITMTNNRATMSGGAIHSDNYLSMSASTLSHNVADFGGGLYLAGVASLANMTVSTNHALSSAGGVFVDPSANVTFDHLTIAANTSAGFGGGIRNGGAAMNLRSTIVGNNTANMGYHDIQGEIRSQGYNLIGTSGGNWFAGDSPNLTGNKVDVPVRLLPLATWNGTLPVHAPMYDSPALDAAVVSVEALTDQNGHWRTVDFTHVTNAPGGDGADIGAVELQIATPDNLIAVPSDGVVLVSFTTGARGGQPIWSHRVTCGIRSMTTTSSSALISGLPNGEPVSCSVVAQGQSNIGVPSALTDEVFPHEPLAFQNFMPTEGTFGVAFAHQPLISGSSPGVWSLDEGELPQGLTINPSTGAITGTPNSVATFSGYIRVDRQGVYITQAFTITIAPGLPAAPTVVSATNDFGAVHVAFNASPDSGGVVLDGFDVNCGNVTQTATDTPATVTGLPLGESTTCRVRARNAAGAGAWSNDSDPVTPRTIPIAPRISHVTPDNAAAMVTFDEPLSSGGSVIIDYAVTCGNESTVVTASPATLTNLPNGVIIDCVVTARNALGFSPQSNPMSVIPDAATSADLSITKTNGVDFVSGGENTTYRIVVTNHGPAGVARARVEDLVEPGPPSPVWTCTPSGGARCASNGTGSLYQAIDLPVNASATIDLTLFVPPLPEFPVTNLASVVAPQDSATDPVPENNVATDGPDAKGVFRSDFE